MQKYQIQGLPFFHNPYTNKERMKHFPVLGLRTAFERFKSGNSTLTSQNPSRWKENRSAFGERGAGS